MFHKSLYIFALISIFLSTVTPKRREHVTTRGHKFKCGPTAPRLDLDISKIYGEWIPIEASLMAFKLWRDVIWEKEHHHHHHICPLFNYKEGHEKNVTMIIEIKYKSKGRCVEAYLLNDENHPGISKWAIGWPNGEDTLTSIVAVGNIDSPVYDWMLVYDCDINGNHPADWAIFSRAKGLSNETLCTIEDIANEIEGVSGTKRKKFDFDKCKNQNTNLES